jgi:hypothetical protein
MEHQRDRRRSVALREFIYPVATAVIIGVISAFSVSYVALNVLVERVDNLERNQAEFKKFATDINRTQVKLAELIGSQQAILVKLDLYFDDMRQLKNDRYTATDAARDKSDLQRQIDYNRKLIEKYH